MTFPAFILETSQISRTHQKTLNNPQSNSNSVEAEMTSFESSDIRLSDILLIFKTKLFLMFAVVFGTSLILLTLPSLAPILMASSRNIPSAFTSVFVHRNLTHLAASATLTLAALLLYSISNTISGKKSDNFIMLAIWLSAAAATLAFVNLAPNARLGGSSSLVSAFLCGVAVTAYINAYTEPTTRVKVAQITIGTVLVGAFVALNLNVGSSWMVTLHLTAFLYMAVMVLTKRFLSSFFSSKS
jgi:hypothetical protein